MTVAKLKSDTGILAAGPDALLTAAADAVAAADKVLAAAKAGVRIKVQEAGGIDNAQHAAHGLAWLATTVEALREMAGWGRTLAGEGRFGEFEQLILAAAFGEYLAQIAGGIPMSQVEIIRPAALGISQKDIRQFEDAVAALQIEGSGEGIKARLAELIAAQPNATSFGDAGLDETHAAIQDQMRRFSLAEVVPYAHEWHLKNEYIPIEVVTKVAELGVFGLTIPEELGGLGLGKQAMCVVSEELSRGYIGVGSLGTRSEIAGELILNNGTPEQKEKYLPRIASGEILPTAVFTEPNTGSDLAALKTRAERKGDSYVVTGQKTWITHPVRAELMTLLVRTNPAEPGHKGLSMLLVEKPRGSDADPFPAKGMTGGEIEVPRAADGHYYLTLQINGTPIVFMADTGATNMVLSRDDARSVGIDPESLLFTGEAATANGVVRTARVDLPLVELGPFRNETFTAFVTDGDMTGSLLGMDYLGQFRLEIAGNRMVLRQ